MGDLPDYHGYVVNVKVEVPPGEEPESWIAEYDSTPEDLPDGSTGPLLCDVKGRLIIVQHEKDRTISSGEVDVARYASAPADLADGDRGPILLDVKGRPVVVQHEKDRTVETAAGKFVRVKGHASDAVPVTLADQEIIPRPKGGVLEKGSVTTTDTYATVASRTVTNGTDFQLAKILVSCDEDVMFKLRWDGTDISAEVYVSGKIPFVDWFPWDYYAMAGDGAKIFDIQVKYPSGGSAGTCHAEIVGEEV